MQNSRSDFRSWQPGLCPLLCNFFGAGGLCHSVEDALDPEMLRFMPLAWKLSAGCSEPTPSYSAHTACSAGQLRQSENTKAATAQSSSAPLAGPEADKPMRPGCLQCKKPDLIKCSAPSLPELPHMTCLTVFLGLPAPCQPPLSTSRSQ